MGANYTSLTPLQQELLLEFTGPEHVFQAPSAAKGARYEDHEDWRNRKLRALEELEERGILQIVSTGPTCKNHGKCHGQPLAAKCRLTEEGEEVGPEAGQTR